MYFDLGKYMIGLSFVEIKFYYKVFFGFWYMLEFYGIKGEGVGGVRGNEEGIVERD